MLIGVLGLNGSGKDTVAEYLAKEHSFTHRSLSDSIRDQLQAEGKNHLDRMLMIELANKMRKVNGNNYWAKKALEGYNPEKKLVLSSIRNPDEIEEIRANGGIIIEVHAEQKTRFDRTVARVQSGTHGETTFEMFKEKEKIEMGSLDPSKQQLRKCVEMADRKISNDGSLEDLIKNIELVLKEIME